MPTYTETTEATYALLPEHHRTADAEQPGDLDLPLKRYLSGPGDQLHLILLLLERLGHLDGDEWESDLADPTEADAAWLPWLAQFVGIDATTMTVPVLRAAIGSGFGRGSWQSMWDVLEAQMPGDWLLGPHSSGDPFLIGLVVPADAPSETWWADLLATLDVLLPAGHDFEVTAVDGPSFAALPALYDSFDEMAAANVDLDDIADGP